MNNVIEELIEIFRKFPGVGPRQAERFVYYLLRQRKDYLSKIARLIPELNSKVKNCTECCRFYISENSNSHVCEICANKNRSNELLMILTRDFDLHAIERSGTYQGKFFVLGGTVPILEKDFRNKIRIDELVKLIQNRTETLKEIILATNANPEGENTAQIVKKEIKTLTDKYNIKITVLGRGLSTGTELEYSDTETLQNALKNRS